MAVSADSDAMGVFWAGSAETMVKAEAHASSKLTATTSVSNGVPLLYIT